MPNSNHRPKITIEDLLHLKRAERPAAEFWSNFERELRQKQLSALLEKRPWWQGWSQLIARRAYLPLGATAILAFTLVSVKFYTPIQVGQVEKAVAGSTVALDHQKGIPAAYPASSEPVSSPLVNRNDQVAPRLDDRAPMLVSNEPSPTEVMDPLPSMTAPLATETPSARTISANFAHLEQSEPELINAVLGSRLSSPARVQPVSRPGVELASFSTSTSKRNRLLAQYNDRPLNPEPTAPAIVRERLSRRLGDTEVNERFSRIGLKGDQVSLKF